MLSSPLFHARDVESKNKIVRFFGEPSILISSGSGSSSKLKAFYGLPSTSAARKHLASREDHGHASPPTIPTQSLASDALTDKPIASYWTQRTTSPAATSSSSEAIRSATFTADAIDALSLEAMSWPSPPSSGKALPVLVPLQPYRTLKKLASLLGDDAGVDIPVKEIGQSQSGLNALLSSKLPLCYFLAYLLGEYRSEILFFALDVQSFEETLFASTFEQNQNARTLFNTYLAAASLLEVNASYRARRQVIDGIQQGLRCCFVPAKEEALVLLDNAFENFRKASAWKEMENDLGNSVVITDAKVAIFKQRIHHVLTKCYLGNDAATQSTKRNVALRSKVPALLMERIGLIL